MFFDFQTMSPSARYFAMVQSIIPRPIAWVLTENDPKFGEQERYNLAPFSFFTGICSDPPLLMISVGKKTTQEEMGLAKDTRLNILERKQFVVHIPSEHQLDRLNQSAASFPQGISEVSELGIELEPFNGFALPRIRDCQIAFACHLYRVDEIGNTPQAVIYGEIAQLFVADAACDENDRGRLIIDDQTLAPLARLGGSHYTGLGKRLLAARPR